MVSGHEPCLVANRADLDQEARPAAEEAATTTSAGPTSGAVGHYVFVYYLFLVIVGFIGWFLVNYHDIAFLYFDDICSF